MTHECETCKNTELNGCDYPCHCCAVVYQNTGFSDMWEQGGCEFCKNVESIYRYKFSISTLDGHVYDVFNDNKINFCPMCGKKLEEV